MTFLLETTVIPPDDNYETKNVIILLHGYGGDGKDISTLTLHWKRFLKNTLFLCPNGHEKCSINSAGYQWFDLSNDDPKYILQESLNAEKKLNKFINEIKKKYKINNSQICISGFSQGSMMSINLGLTADENYNCIVGFSGKIIDKENLKKRIKSNTKTLLIHGDSDQVVAPSNLLDAKDFFIRNKLDIQTKMITNCDHHISTEASSIALNFIKNNLYN